jgi:hypothetical protein
MRPSLRTALTCAALAAVAGCGDDEPAALPGSGAAYRALSGEERLTAAAACRDRAVAAADGIAADQIGRVDPEALRAQLDLALKIAPDRRGTFSELCEERLPYVTPGLEVAVSGATRSGAGFTYQTRSDKPLTLRGSVAPAGRGGYVTARRETGAPTPFRGRIDARGRFEMPTVRLRKQADNSFLLTIHAAPNALRKVRFSAICVDCLAAGPPPASD